MTKVQTLAVTHAEGMTTAQTREQCITSLEIAQLTGKMHKDVMKAIRNMEPAWEQEHGRKFALMQIREDLPNNGYRLRPVFSLTKIESLYIATKFNDVARARLVLRWEELEKKSLTQPLPKGRENEAPLMLETEEEMMKRCDSIRRQQIGSENAPSDGCMTASEVAKMLDMETKDLNRLLVTAGLQFWNGGRYKLTDDYQGRGLTKGRKFHYYSLDGEKKERFYLVWTPEGADYIRRMVNG